MDKGIRRPRPSEQDSHLVIFCMGEGPVRCTSTTGALA